MKGQNPLAALLKAFREANSILDTPNSPRVFAAFGSAYLGCVIGLCFFRFPPDPLLAVVTSPFVLGFAPWIPGMNLILLAAVVSLIAFSVSRLPYYWVSLVGILFACATYFSIDAWRVG